jgi:hypothetical protein
MDGFVVPDGFTMRDPEGRVHDPTGQHAAKQRESDYRNNLKVKAWKTGCVVSAACEHLRHASWVAVSLNWLLISNHHSTA